MKIEAMNTNELQFINLGEGKEVSAAIRDGLLNGSDSPRGYLCTLCGAMVANQDLHIKYHAIDYTILRVLSEPPPESESEVV